MWYCIISYRNKKYMLSNIMITRSRSLKYYIYGTLFDSLFYMTISFMKYGFFFLYFIKHTLIFLCEIDVYILVLSLQVVTFVLLLVHILFPISYEGVQIYSTKLVNIFKVNVFLFWCLKLTGHVYCSCSCVLTFSVRYVIVRLLWRYTW